MFCDKNIDLCRHIKSGLTATMHNTDSLCRPCPAFAQRLRVEMRPGKEFLASKTVNSVFTLYLGHVIFGGAMFVVNRVFNQADSCLRQKLEP